MAEKKSNSKEQTFEESLKRIEEIVKDMEGGSLSLDKMMSHFEEGMKLVHFCSGKLNEVERKIEVLVKKGEQVTTQPFSTGNE